MEIIRMVFQQADLSDRKRMILVLDMQDQMTLSTAAIPGLIEKMQAALPEIFPDASQPFAHKCGGLSSDTPEHNFRDELTAGTDIPHLLEHVLLHLLSRRVYSCAGFCGQRSSDLDQGITTHYYIVVDCPSEIEAVVAVSIGLQLVSAWADGRAVTIDPGAVFRNIRDTIEPMLSSPVTQPGKLRQN